MTTTEGAPKKKIENTTKQMGLVRDTGPEGFMERVQAMLCRVAVDVLAEPGTTPFHPQRAAYAQRVLAQPMMAANQAGTTISMGTAVTAATTYDESSKKSTCTLIDDDLHTQVLNLWNALAGVDASAPQDQSVPLRTLF